METKTRLLQVSLVLVTVFYTLGGYFIPYMFVDDRNSSIEGLTNIFIFYVFLAVTYPLLMGIILFALHKVNPNTVNSIDLPNISEKGTLPTKSIFSKIGMSIFRICIGLVVVTIAWFILVYWQ